MLNEYEEVEKKVTNRYLRRVTLSLLVCEGSFSTYASFTEKLTFFTPLIRTLTCAYQGVKNVNFSEHFA